MPSSQEILHRGLTKFQSVSNVLQQKDRTISVLDVRALFEKLISEYGSDFEEYISADANIVLNTTFEKAIVKNLLGENLNTSEIR